MKKTILMVLIIWCYPQAGSAYQISAEFLLKNNVSHRKYLRSVTLHQKIKFLEGLYSPAPFTCHETIYFQSHEKIRIDYQCGDVTYTHLYEKPRVTAIYHQKITPREARSPHFLTALFLYKKEDPLIRLMSDFQFVHAEVKEPAPDPLELTEEDAPPLPKKPKEKKEKQETEWDVTGTVSLTKLGKLEKSQPEKMEDNSVLLLSSPVDSGQQIWFSKKLFLPQKISYAGRDILFRNYREVSNQYNLFFRYPQFIEIQETGISGIIIESLWDRLEINPKYEKDFFNAETIVKKRSTSFPQDSKIKIVLEKFISEYR